MPDLKVRRFGQLAILRAFFRSFLICDYYTSEITEAVGERAVGAVACPPSPIRFQNEIIHQGRREVHI